MSFLSAAFGPTTNGNGGYSKILGGVPGVAPDLVPNPAIELLPRVCLYTDSDVYAGTESHILELARGLRLLGVPVTIAAPVPSALVSRAEPLGIRILAIPKQGLLDVAAIRIFRRLLIDGQLDVLHAHNGRTAMAAALAVRAAGAGGGVAIATQHFLEPNHSRHTGLKGQISRFAHEWVARRIHAHVAISEAVRESMIDRQEVPPARITVVLNGISPVDPSTLLPAATVRQNLGLSAATPLIVCMARLEREKNIETLIAAMPKVLAQVPDAQCVILGDGARFDALHAQIIASGAKVSSNVRLLGFRSDALSILAAADIFVLPSLAEPFGLAIVEAMALGKPVIATRAGGPREIVTHGQTGLVVTPEDPAELSAALLTLLLDRPLRESMAAAGIVRFRNHFTAERMSRGMLTLYQRVVKTTRRTSGHEPASH